MTFGTGLIDVPMVWLRSAVEEYAVTMGSNHVF